MKEFYQQTITEIRTNLNSHTSGLSEEEAERNRKKYGKNEITDGKKKKTWQIFLEQFKDFLVIILICAAAVSGFLGDFESTIVILAVITLNAILGTVQTIKAEHSLQSLKKLSAPEAKVIRDGMIKKIPAEEIAAGDIVMIEAGDYIPADGRIIEHSSLKIDESALSGESVPVEKNTQVLQGETALSDRTNMVFSGSFVTYGRGSFIVTAVGMNTEVGKIAGLLKSASEKKTPLQLNLDKFGQKLSVLILIFCSILFGISVVRGENIGNAFLFAIALAVAAIPEALSSIVTIVLSFGTQKMAKEHAVIRKLQAVEGLGSVSVICSDKTGTLTQNKMTVEDYYTNGKRINAKDIDLSDSCQRLLLSHSILCNTSTNEKGIEIGDPTETALINLGTKLGVSILEERNKYPKVCDLPFDSDRKLMSSVHNINGNNVMIVKGAADVMINRVCQIKTQDGIQNITDNDKENILAQNHTFSKEGLRVLALSFKNNFKNEFISEEDENDLIFLGLIAMMDPPRIESAEAVEKCKKAGIKPIMITGDHKTTASAIAKRIGILENFDEACEGREIDSLSDEELKNFVEKISVYARVSPEHKIRIVKAWQDKGNIVAMTGDGVNDAPALKQADIGVAMGITGTEVSKDAASMVLTDDNFSTIVKAVENGRNVYRNIKHSIEFLLSGNFGAILAVLYASIGALPLPFAPVHLLFINLLTDSMPAIALGLEPHSPDVMNDKPRPVNENILTKSFLGKIGLEGLIISIMTMTGFYMGYLEGGAALGSTMAFGTLCISRLIHGFNCKAKSGIKFLFNNKYLIFAFLTGMVLILSVLTMPIFSSVFKVIPLDFIHILIICLLAFLNLPIIQFFKYIIRKQINRTGE